MGRQIRRRAAPWLDDDARIQEIDSEDEYNLRNGRAGYTRQLVGRDLDGASGLRRRMVGYDEYGDEPESMDGTDYDLYDDADSTVAYAVHLAMKDKEDWLVDKALERIRRAQVMGQQNVRLSKSEVDALERKRMQTGSETLDRKRAGERPPDGGVGKEGVRRGPSSAMPGKPTASYGILDDGDVFKARPRSSGSPTSQRPRSLRSPQPVASPRTPLDSPYKPDRQPTIPHVRSQASSPLKSPSFARPLPDDPHWVPPYPLPYPREPPPYPLHSPMEPRRGGSSNRTGLSPYVSNYEDRPPSSARNSFTPWYSPAKTAAEAPQDEEDEEESDSDGESGDELHIVDVVERRVPTSTRLEGSRQRRNRP